MPQCCEQLDIRSRPGKHHFENQLFAPTDRTAIPDPFALAGSRFDHLGAETIPASLDEGAAPTSDDQLAGVVEIAEVPRPQLARWIGDTRTKGESLAFGGGNYKLAIFSVGIKLLVADHPSRGDPVLLWTMRRPIDLMGRDGRGFREAVPD